MVEQQIFAPTKYRFAPYLLLICGFVITVYLSYAVKSDIEFYAQRQFVNDCKEIQLHIDSHLQSHKLVLLGGVSLFNASTKVTRSEWHDYVKLMQIDQHFKGIQGLGFAELIPKSQLQQHTDEIRREGFADYRINPPGERDVYSTIIYLEPFKDRNLQAFGYDMFADPTRRAAMQAAVNQNQITLSDKVILVQETKNQVQPGMLMYAPVYKKNWPIESPSQRWQALMGWVYSPFRMEDFINGILEGRFNPDGFVFNLQIYSGESINPDNLLYSQYQAPKQSSNLPDPSNQLSFNSHFNGRPLHYVFQKISSSKIDYSRAWLTLLSGLLTNYLFFQIATSVEHKHRRSINFNTQTKSELDQKSQELEYFFDVNLDLLCIADTSGRLLKLNPEWHKTLGYTLEQLMQSNFLNLIHPEDLEATHQALSSLTQQQPVLNFINRYRHQDGSYRWIEWRAMPAKQLIFAAARDITERKKTEETLLFSRERLYFALQGATDGFWDWNLETDKVYYSPRWKSMLGYQEQELSDSFSTWKALAHPDDIAHTLQHVQDYLNNVVEHFEIEFRMRHKLGHWVYILSRAKLAVDQAGSIQIPRRLIGTHVDITERKAQEQRRIKEQIELRDTLVKEVHHRIKNNMQGITGILRQYAQTHPQLDEPINHAISQMQSIAIIHGLQGSNPWSEVILSELINAISIGVGNLWKFNIDYQPDPRAERLIVEQTEAVPIALVLNELILNAVKHSNYNSVVHISLKLKLEPIGVDIEIRNSGQLPAGFETCRDGQRITGLFLVTSLLPRVGAKLDWHQQAGQVLTRLYLAFPIIKQET